MSKTRWTDNQKKAIYNNGTNILVSAGAGSGKTAVLTERILEKLKNNISIDNLIVLTFTNASAFEMKERVRNKLKNEINNGSEFLKIELEKIDNSNICTFDSFCLNIVKKYHYLLDISKNVNICDNILLQNKKNEILNEIFEKYYEKEDIKFLELIDTFTVKDDKKIKTIILNFDNDLNNIINKDAYLENYIKNYYSDKNLNLFVLEYTETIKKIKEKLFYNFENFQILINHEKIEEFSTKIYSNISFLEKANTYEKYKNILNYKMPTFPRGKALEDEDLDGIKKIFQKIKANFSEIKELCCYENEEEIKNEIAETKKYADIIVQILKEFRNKIVTYKKKNSIYEFSDISDLAINLLTQNEKIRNNFKNNINEIMIDEYQDTNDINEYVVSLIANNNVYMVGDVKQSIYGFRNANPALFMNKYDQYGKNNDGIKIDLLENFRSREEVLFDINLIFDNLMTINKGGADYQNAHQMIYGNKTFDNKEKKQKYNYDFLNYTYEKNKYTKDEIEAYIVAKDIKEKIINNFKILENGTIRKVNYKDFTILMDRKISFDTYKKIFNNIGIPLSIHKDEAFIKSNEILVIKNILIYIYSVLNKETDSNNFKHAFTSVARSFLFKYNDKQIFDIFDYRKNNNITFYKAISENKIFENFNNKFSNIIKNINSYSLLELLDIVYEKFEIYNLIYKLENAEIAKEKLGYLLDSVKSLETLNYTLEDLIKYFESAFENDVDSTFSVTNSEKSAVNIMTIHKSKGLEFNICYYSGLYKKFNKPEQKEKFLFDKKYGFILPIFSEGIKETVLKKLFTLNNKSILISEQIRLFYVALTRAREKMIFVGDLSSYDDFDNEYNSFLDFVGSMKNDVSKNLYNVDYINIDNELKDKQNIKNIESTLSNQIKTINYKQENVKAENNSSIRFYYSKNEKELLRMGTKLHNYLEILDFNNREESYKKYNISNFYQEKVEKFFELSIIKVLENPIYLKEYEYIYKERKNIIDLLIDTKDKILIIDYKTKDINKESYIKQLNRYKEYIESISKKEVECYLYSLIDSEILKI